MDAAGNVYVADYDNQRVRKIAPDQTVVTLARSRGCWHPRGVAVQNDRVYVLERAGNYWGPTGILDRVPFFFDLVGQPRLRIITPEGRIELVAGLSSRPVPLGAAGLRLLGAGAIAWGVRRRVRCGPSRTLASWASRPIEEAATLGRKLRLLLTPDPYP